MGERMRRWWVAAFVAVLVAVGGVAYAVAAPSSHVHRPPSAGAAPPAGMRAVTIADVQLDVPTSWSTNQMKCGRAVEPTIVWSGTADLGGGELCELYVVGAFALSLGPPSPVDPSPSTSNESTTVAGVAATEEVFVGGVTEFDLPSRGTAIEFDGAPDAVVRQVMATAHPVTTDAAGCPVRVGGVGPAGVLCSYADDGWLFTSTTLRPGDQQKLDAGVARAAGSTACPVAVWEQGRKVCGSSYELETDFENAFPSLPRFTQVRVPTGCTSPQCVLPTYFPDLADR